MHYIEAIYFRCESPVKLASKFLGVSVSSANVGVGVQCESNDHQMSCAGAALGSAAGVRAGQRPRYFNLTRWSTAPSYTLTPTEQLLGL